MLKQSIFIFLLVACSGGSTTSSQTDNNNEGNNGGEEIPAPISNFTFSSSEVKLLMILHLPVHPLEI